MLHTYEAVLQPDGRLQFLDLPLGENRSPRRVLVTFTDEVASSPDPAPTMPAASTADWPALAGTLKTSPNWQGDPQAVQEAMRHDWD